MRRITGGRGSEGNVITLSTARLEVALSDRDKVEAPMVVSILLDVSEKSPTHGSSSDVAGHCVDIFRTQDVGDHKIGDCRWNWMIVRWVEMAVRQRGEAFRA